MPTSRDSSLLFSLKELEHLERDRVAAERRDREASASAERRAFEEAERLAREEELRKIEEAERRRRAEEALRRDEAARHAAIERAAVAEARAGVEARAFVEAEHARLLHEASLAALKRESSQRLYRFLLAVSALATTMALGFAGLVSSDLHAHEELEQRRAEVAMREHDEYETAVRALEASRRAVSALERKVEDLRAATAPPEVPATTDPRKPSIAQPLGPRKGGAGAKTGGRRGRCGESGDPLDGCLK
jgi:hypothetical protein